MRKKKEAIPHQNVGLNNNKPRPEIRDNLDHREKQEQQHKGSHVTHNKKDVHNAPRKGKR